AADAPPRQHPAPPETGIRDPARHVVPRRPDGSLLRRAHLSPHATARLFRDAVRVAAAARTPDRRTRPHAPPLATARLRAVAPPVSRYGRGGVRRCSRGVRHCPLFPGSACVSVAPALLRLTAVKSAPQFPLVIFLTSFHPGGTEQQMTELIRRLDRSRFEIHVACFHKEGSWLPRVEACAPVTAFPIRGFARPGTLARAAAFARWCRAHRIAGVLTCDLYANSFALPAAALGGVSTRIGSRRELNPDKSAAQIALQRHAYRFAHAIVANSRAASRQLEREGVPLGRVRVIPTGIAAERFSGRLATSRLATVVTVANLRTEKAHEVLLEAAARLAPRYSDLKFRIIGDGPREAELRALAAGLGVTDRVEF